MSKKEATKLLVIISVIALFVFLVAGSGILFTSIFSSIKKLINTYEYVLSVQNLYTGTMSVKSEVEKIHGIIIAGKEPNEDQRMSALITLMKFKNSINEFNDIYANKKNITEFIDILNSYRGTGFIILNLIHTAELMIDNSYDKMISAESMINKLYTEEISKIDTIEQEAYGSIKYSLIMFFCIISVSGFLFYKAISSLNKFDKAIKEKTKIQIEKIKHERLHAEMNDIAIQVQKSIFPDHLGDIGAYNIAAHLESAGSVGGDGVDAIPMGDITYVVISDVCGHDFTSSILAALFTAIRAIIYAGENDIANIMRAINRYIYEISQKLCRDKFITFMLFACHDSGECYYVGSHPDALLYNSITKKIVRIKTDPNPSGTGLWAGIVKDEYFAARNYTPKKFYMNPGDTLIAYTDGIIEAFSKSSDGVQYGIDDFQDDFLSIIGNDPETIQKLLIEKLNDNYTVDDDTTLLIARKK